MQILKQGKLLACIALAAVGLSSGVARADSGADTNTGSGDILTWIDSKPINEVWLNPGFLSYHWDRDKDLNGDNYGIGAEYRFSTVAALTAGEFYNSDRAHSKYVGVYYQPIDIGPVRFGAVVGGFDGYPKEKNGGWFPAFIPVASYEYKMVGLNLAFVPSYQDRLYGALTFQLKLKIY
jgi:hypothetical protein